MIIENTTTEAFTYELGNVNKGASKSFTVTFLNKTVEFIKVGCGSCTKATHKKSNNDVEVTVIYTALDSKGVPYQKTVTVNFTDGTKQVIKFKGKVI